MITTLTKDLIAFQVWVLASSISKDCLDQIGLIKKNCVMFWEWKYVHLLKNIQKF